MNTKVIVLLALLAVIVTVAQAKRAKRDYYSEYNYDGPVYPESDSESYGANEAINWARSKIGGCYSQKNRDGNPCYDCSSFVYYAWQAGGKNIGVRSTGEYPGRLTPVSANQLQPGDILWKSGHVGLYIGGGQYIHAVNPSLGIKQSNVANGGFTRFYRP
jgi:cell wall-associated NlpC family hydrolase